VGTEFIRTCGLVKGSRSGDSLQELIKNKDGQSTHLPGRRAKEGVIGVSIKEKLHQLGGRDHVFWRRPDPFRVTVPRRKGWFCTINEEGGGEEKRNQNVVSHEKQLKLKKGTALLPKGRGQEVVKEKDWTIGQTYGLMDDWGESSNTWSEAGCIKRERLYPIKWQKSRKEKELVGRGKGKKPFLKHDREKKKG